MSNKLNLDTQQSKNIPQFSADPGNDCFQVPTGGTITMVTDQLTDPTCCPCTKPASKSHNHHWYSSTCKCSASREQQLDVLCFHAPSLIPLPHLSVVLPPSALPPTHSFCLLLFLLRQDFSDMKKSFDMCRRSVLQWSPAEWVNTSYTFFLPL